MKNTIKKLNFLFLFIFMAVVVCIPFFCGCTLSCTKTVCDDYILYQNYSYGQYGERNLLDLAVPRKSGNCGLILSIHGGGWMAGNKEGQIESAISWAKKGYAYAAINYRYISGSVHCFDIINDITKSLCKIKELGNENELNINKMLLTGGSAGGHLSLFYAYTQKEFSPIEPTCVISLSGPTDLLDENFYSNQTYLGNYKKMFSNLCGEDITGNNTEYINLQLKSVSPLYYVSTSTVPTVICHATLDEVVPYSNATKLSEKLTEFSVENELITFSNSNHGLENDIEAKNKMNNKFLEFAEKYL